MRRLLAALAGPAARREARLRWSAWRRAHQAAARRGHAARRAGRHPPPSAHVPRVIAVPGTPALTEARWARLAPLLPPARGRAGRPPGAHRPILAGLLWMMRAGASWREIPTEYGPWQTLHSRYCRWRRSGLWPRLVAALHAPAADAAEPT